MRTLAERIDHFYDNHVNADREEVLRALAELRQALNRGEARVAEPEGEGWRLNVWVKRGILLHHLIGRLEGAERDGFSRSIRCLAGGLRLAIACASHPIART